MEDSLHRVYQEQPPNCMLVFTEPKPAHDIIREKILANAIESKMGMFSWKASDFPLNRMKWALTIVLILIEKRKLNDSPTDKYFHGDTSAASDVSVTENRYVIS